MKIKLLTAAVILAASTNASAAILGEELGTAAGQSEAVFTIWDPTTSQSYAQDLGTTWQTFRDNLTNASFSQSYTVDSAIYAQAVGASDTANLVWNVSVAEGSEPNFLNFGDFGIIGTSNLGNVINTAAIANGIGRHNGYYSFLNSLSADSADIAANEAYFGTVTNGVYAGDERVWGTSWNTNGATNNTAAFGTDLDFYYYQDTGLDTLGAITKAAGSWSFDGTTLSYGAGAPPAVPVPAAAWLFGSGLLGLVGVARRRAHQA